MLTKWRTTLAVCLIALSTSSCVSDGPVVVNSFCAEARPIYLAPDDTVSSATERAILAHNEKGAERCGWKPVGDP